MTLKHIFSVFRLTLIFLFFFLSLTLSAQSPNSNDWIYLLESIKDSVETDWNMVRWSQLSERPEDEFFLRDCPDALIEANWLQKDLNADGKEDLIFSGACLQFHTVIFLRTNRGFENVLFYPGKLLQLEVDTFAQRATKIHIFKPSCCCDYYNDLISVSITSYDSVYKQILDFHYDTQLKFSQIMRDTSASGIVRTTPMINDSPEINPCNGYLYTGNRLDSIQNQKITILGSKLPRWRLVLYQKSDIHWRIGWMRL